jgi:predicted phage-related endonuclease
VNTHNLVQGSEAWLSYRRNHFNASDAPAMMNASPYKTRAALLRELSTGLAPEVDASTQYLFDRGHKFEGASRGMAETILGQELYPVVGSLERLSASFDGLTMADDIVWEHKTLNNELRKCFAVMESIAPEHRERAAGRELPLHHRIQMEQQLHISGAEKALFTASRWSDDGELLEAVHCWYFPDMQLRNEILTGWVQFSRDLASYSPTAAAEVIVPAAVTALPGVSVQVTGSIVVADNFKTFEVALREFIDKRLIRKPTTDQDFADLDQQIKALKAAEAALDGAEAQMVAQVKSIDDAKRIKDMLVKLARDNRLMAEKLLEARKTEIREEIVAAARRALHEHAAALASECAPAALNLAGVGDFAGAIKGKRTVQTLRESCDAELARARIALDNQARGIRANLVAYDAAVGRNAFLFPDLSTLLHKAADDFTAAVRQRVAEHEAKELKRQEDERERIRAEEEARAEQRAAAARLDEQRQADAKAQAEAAAAKAAATPPPAPTPAPTPTGILDRGESAAGKALVNAMAPPPAPAPAANEPATLKLGTICERLAPVAITAAGLEALGIRHSATAGAARLYRESDFPRICAAIADCAQRAAAHDWRVAA